MLLERSRDSGTITLKMRFGNFHLQLTWTQNWIVNVICAAATDSSDRASLYSTTSFQRLFQTDEKKKKRRSFRLCQSETRGRNKKIVMKINWHSDHISFRTVTIIDNDDRNDNTETREENLLIFYRSKIISLAI